MTSLNLSEPFHIDINLYSKKAYDAFMLTRCLEQSSGFTRSHFEVPPTVRYSQTHHAFSSYEAIWILITSIHRNTTNGGIEFTVRAPGSYLTKGGVFEQWNEFVGSNRVEQLKQFVTPLKKTLKFLNEIKKESDKVIVKSTYTAPFKPHTFEHFTTTEDNIYRLFGMHRRMYVHTVYKSTYKVLIALFSGMPIEDVIKKYGKDLVDDVVGQPLNPFAASQIKEIYSEEERLAELGKKRINVLYNTIQHFDWFKLETLLQVLKIYNDIEAEQKKLEDSIDL